MTGKLSVMISKWDFAASESSALNFVETDTDVSDKQPEFLHEVPVKYKKDQHLEVNIYSFPNDYETAVKYWYTTFQQLHLLTSLAPNQPLSVLRKYTKS
ncbi:unnamed protein product [Heterobilharzia americana]|nr:unnamed protein product [Heterobilharzia americana]